MIKGSSIHPTAAQVLSAEGGRAASKAPKISLQKGEVFLGHVDKLLSKGMALISAKGGTLVASTEVSLREGSVYSLKVESVHPRLVLKATHGPGDRLPGALEIWVRGKSVRDRLFVILMDLARSPKSGGLSGDLTVDLRRLHDLLQAVVYQGSDQMDWKWLEGALVASGIFWEHRLLRNVDQAATGRLHPPIYHKDLKGLLTKVLAALEGVSATQDGLSSLVAKAREALFFIEDQQLLNLHGGETGWYWFLPGSRERGFHYAEFFGRRLEGTSEQHLHLLMEFSHLGQVVADLSLTQSGITAILRVEDAAKASLISNHLEDLEQGLRKVGIKISGLQCAIRDEDWVPDWVPEWGSPTIDVLA